MGLSEKRALKELEDNRIPELVTELNEAAGYELKVDVDLGAVLHETDPDDYDEYITKVYFQPTADAIRRVTADEIGREALKGALKGVRFLNSGDHLQRSGRTFEDGVLTVDQRLGNVDEMNTRVEKTVEVLEEKL